MTVKLITASAVAKSAAFDPDAPAPQRFRVGPPFDALDFRPGRVVLIGAPPAKGKSALVVQLTAGALQHNPDLRAVVANVEMPPADLLAKIAARLSGVPVDHIMEKTYTGNEKDRVKQTLAAHAPLLDRLAFLEPPYCIDHVAEALDEFPAKLAVVDYVQRFAHGIDLRQSIDGLMSGLRRLASAGAAVVAVSSVARQKDDKGRSGYDGLNMASFRGSAELEFGADSAYLLDASDGAAVLRCVKNRFGKPADIHLRFAGEFQRYDAGDPFDAFDTAPGTPSPKGKKR